MTSVANWSIALRAPKKHDKTVRSAAFVYCHVMSTISANVQTAGTRVAETALIEIAKCRCLYRACTATEAIHLSASYKRVKRKIDLLPDLTVSCADARSRALKSSTAAQITSIFVVPRALRAETSYYLTCLLEALQSQKGTCLHQSKESKIKIVLHWCLH